jgi:hypothetical protein
VFFSTLTPGVKHNIKRLKQGTAVALVARLWLDAALLPARDSAGKQLMCSWTAIVQNNPLQLSPS